MTTATDHKNNLNSSALKKNYVRTLRVETIASSAGGTAEVAIVAQPRTGFLNASFYPDGSPTEDTEDCLGRITVGLTRSKSLTVLASLLDIMGLMGMAQVIATIAYGIHGLRRGDTTWEWPNFHADPERKNREQMRRWSLNKAPSWLVPPLAIANRYHDPETNQPKRMRYRLILVRASALGWLRGDRFKDLQAQVKTNHRWIPAQQLLFDEIILYAYAADRTSRVTYVCLPSGLHNARTGRILVQAGPDQEITPLPGIYFFDGWRVNPTLVIPANLPSTKEAPVFDVEASAPSTTRIEPARSPEEEALDILATAAKNQAENGPNSRRAAIRACKYLRAMVSQHGQLIQSAHEAAKSHTQRSKGTAEAAASYRPQASELPVISPELTSEPLHCLSTLPDPWPLTKVTIDMENPASGSPKCADCILRMTMPGAR